MVVVVCSGPFAISDSSGNFENIKSLRGGVGSHSGEGVSALELASVSITSHLSFTN